MWTFFASALLIAVLDYALFGLDEAEKGKINMYPYDSFGVGAFNISIVKSHTRKHKALIFYRPNGPSEICCP